MIVGRSSAGRLRRSRQDAMFSIVCFVAASLATLLLLVVLVLYWTYDRIVGIDNVKLG